MNKCPNVNLRMQTSGTCWFHSIINPLILSRRLRPFLYKAMAEYINIHIKDRAHLEDWLKRAAPSCISPSKPYSRIFAMKKIWTILFYQRRMNFPTPYRPNPNYASQNNIRNLFAGNFRNPSHNFNKGAYTAGQWPTALERIGFLNYTVFNQDGSVVVDKGGPTKDFIVIVSVNSPSVSPSHYTVTHNGSVFELDCATVNMLGNPANFLGAVSHVNHAITGFRCGNQFRIFDSNMEQSYICDWRDTVNVINHPEYKKAVVKKYGMSVENAKKYGKDAKNAKWTEGKYSALIYVRSDLSNSLKAFNEDALQISPHALALRLKKNQNSRNELAEATKLSLLQEKMNAEAGMRISEAKKKANANAKAAKEKANANAKAAKEKANANARVAKAVSNAIAARKARQASNETERRNAARRARLQAEKVKANENAIKEILRKGKMPANTANLGKWMAQRNLGGASGSNQRQAPARPANQRPPNLNLTQFERANMTSVYNSAKNLIRTLKSKNYKQLKGEEKYKKLKRWLGPLFGNNYPAMLNFATRLPYEKTNIDSLRGEPINKNWNKSTNRIKRLLWSVSKRNSS